MMEFDNIVREFIQIFKSSYGTDTRPLDTQAQVLRVENGVAWVHIPGGVEETPVKLTVNAEAGDTVQVRIGGGRAWITGNATNPPTDDKTAIKSGKIAQIAQKKASTAKETADGADSKAKDALKLAEGINEHFWHNNTGAHITQVTQEEYEDDPANAGGNLLMTSGGMAVRNGTAELASFTGTQAQIGKSGHFHTMVDDDSMTFDDGNGNTFSIEAFYRDGVNGGRITKMVDAINRAELAVRSDGRESHSMLYSSFYDDGVEETQEAWVNATADMDTQAMVSLHAYDDRNGTAKSAYADLTTEKFETTVPIVAPNMAHGTTKETSSIASGGDYTFSINFGKTFPSVPSVVCSLVDVKNGSGGAVDAHQVVASVSTITTTSCKIKIHNNGTQARKCKISWIAMSN